uniref:Uncharacterized protein n=1 Tax=Anopheles melas TaxID=34690 RepID=A0A182U559_9DIPT
MAAALRYVTDENVFQQKQHQHSKDHLRDVRPISVLSRLAAGAGARHDVQHEIAAVRPDERLVELVLVHQVLVVVQGGMVDVRVAPVAPDGQVGEAEGERMVGRPGTVLQHVLVHVPAALASKNSVSVWDDFLELLPACSPPLLPAVAADDDDGVDDVVCCGCCWSVPPRSLSVILSSASISSLPVSSSSGSLLGSFLLKQSDRQYSRCTDSTFQSVSQQDACVAGGVRAVPLTGSSIGSGSPSSAFAHMAIACEIELTLTSRPPASTDSHCVKWPYASGVTRHPPSGSPIAASNPADTSTTSGSYSYAIGSMTEWNAATYSGSPMPFRFQGMFTLKPRPGPLPTTHVRVLLENVLRAVAVVHVPVDDQDAPQPVPLDRMPGRHRDAVVDAETVRRVRLRVVTGRAHHAHARPGAALQHVLHHGQHRAGRHAGARVRARMEVDRVVLVGRLLHRARLAHLADQAHVLRPVHQTQLLGGGEPARQPLHALRQLVVPGQPLHDLRDALRLLRVPLFRTVAVLEHQLVVHEADAVGREAQIGGEVQPGQPVLDAGALVRRLHRVAVARLVPAGLGRRFRRHVAFDHLVEVVLRLVQLQTLPVLPVAVDAVQDGRLHALGRGLQRFRQPWGRIAEQRLERERAALGKRLETVATLQDDGDASLRHQQQRAEQMRVERGRYFHTALRVGRGK